MFMSCFTMDKPMSEGHSQNKGGLGQGGTTHSFEKCSGVVPLIFALNHN
jgi:hypothetical protein